MALPKTTIEVPLTVVDQISPTTAQITGRLTKLIDGQVLKFQSQAIGNVPNAVRFEKRPAFTTLSNTVRSSVDGSVQGSVTLNNQSLLSTFQDRLILVSNDQTFVYSEYSDAWEQHLYQLPTASLSQNYIHTSNTVAIAPDFASAGGIRCYTWFVTSGFNSGGAVPKEVSGCYFRVLDPDGVVLRNDTLLNSTDTRVKCIVDGGLFWIFSEKGDGTGNFNILLVDENGHDLATATIACTYTAPAHWDITDTGFGPLLAQAASTGVRFTKFSYNGTSISATSATDTGIAGNTRIGFATNNVDGNAYLLTAEHVGTGNNTIHLYQIPSSLAHSAAQTVATSQADEPANLTGYVVPGSSTSVVVAWSIIDNTSSPNTNYLKNVVHTALAPLSGSVTTINSIYSMNLASRAFAIGPNYYAVGYYPSNLAQVAASELVNQPTYFLLPLSNANQQTAGRWEYATAYADWQSSGSAYNFSLASASPSFPNTGIETALCYRAESFTSKIIQVFGDVGSITQTLASTVGVKSYTFGNPGQSVSYSNEIVLPGPGASSWSGGYFSESGIALAFEQPIYTIQSTSGTPPALTPGTYQYIVVGEWTDTNGNRVRSRPSPALQVTVAANEYVHLEGFMVHATNKSDMLISIYRTDMVSDSGGGYVPTTLHYKITVDAAATIGNPLYNDPTVSALWSFDDSNVNITANEILYTDKGMLENHPACPFSRGCVWQDRVCLVAPDNSIWLSSEPTPGDALWWNPAISLTIPTSDPITAVVASTEGYLLALCENSLWYYPQVNLPDATGNNGTLPTAIELKYNMGCVGQAIPTKEGCVFASSLGGLWLIPRDLTSLVWLSENVSDDLAGPVLALTIDSQQRIYAYSGVLGVYDTIAGCWYEWNPPTVPNLLASYKGLITYSDGSLVWQQLPGNYCDIQYVGGITTLLPYHHSASLAFMHVGGIKNYKRLYQVIFSGQSFTGCPVQVQVSYDDDPTIIETKTFTTTDNTPLLQGLKPMKQLCSSVAFTLTETGGSVSNRGFALETISLAIGIEPGLTRVPILKRF